VSGLRDQATGRWIDVFIPGEKPKKGDGRVIGEVLREQAIEPNRDDVGRVSTPAANPEKPPPLINPYLGPSAAMANRLTRMGSARGMVERPRNIADLRNPMIMGAATLGGAAALPFAPPTAGGSVAVGAMLGAGAGSTAHDLTAHYGRKLGLVGPGKLLEDDPR
jgi:hypothetical protein